MKTIKLLFSAIMMMVAFTVQAQTVQVYKSGAVVKEYPASEVKSVEVKQVYYYYAGWECPTNEEELANMATRTSVQGNGTDFIAGFKLTNTGFTNSSPMLSIDNTLTHSSKALWYIVVPVGIKIYDVTLPNDHITDASFTKVTNININGYNIYQFNDASRNITGIQLYN